MIRLFNRAVKVLLFLDLCQAFVVGPASRTSAFVTTSKVLQSTPSSSSRTSALQMAYKNVFVAGGSRGVGRLVIDKLLENGSQVKALVRSQDVADELNDIEGVTAVLGDAFVQKSVENALDGCDAAITTLGGSTDDRRIDYEGNSNVIESAGILGVQRIILVTSVGCGSSREAGTCSL
jgi:NADPH:quinone reductase-like Zn-dependent oxidoreductase